MTLRTLIRRSLRFHWRSHLGVVLGAAIGSAALTGALVVGDSVKGSLRERALLRLGAMEAALRPTDRFVREDLAERLIKLAPLDSSAGYAPVVMLPARVTRLDGGARANAVQLVGVDGRMSSFGGEFWREPIKPGTAWVNEALALQLRVNDGDTLLVRAAKPAGPSREAATSSRSDDVLGLRLQVAGRVPDSAMGSMALSASGQPVLNVFMRLAELQEQAGVEGRANAILARTEPVDRLARIPDPSATPARRLSKAWRLPDTQAETRALGSSTVELRSERVFIDPPIERAALKTVPEARPILTYVANLLASGTNATPYSMVTAADAPWTPTDLADDQIVLNQWLADDLQAGPGDIIMLTHYDPESGARLVEHTNTFRVHSIVPMDMPWADRTLMPDFPGIEKAESARDWDTAFPLVHEVRQKDDDYWQKYRGTPKAFVTLAAGKRMWANRFGDVTAIRFDPLSGPPLPDPGRSGPEDAPLAIEKAERQPTSAATDQAYRAWLERAILAHLDPAELGLRFEPVREQALRAAAESQDFGGLFLGFSLFVIASALILMALLFQFGLERRASEIGTLLAMGFTPKRVRRLFLGEGAALALIGSVIGVAAGVFYAKLMLLGLTTVWRDAVGAGSLKFFVTPLTLFTGLLAATLVAAITIWLALRKQARQPAIQLLNAEGRMQSAEWGGQLRARGAGWSGLALLAALGLVGWTLVRGDFANAGAFFGAGALVLLAGLGGISAWLRRLTQMLPPTPQQPVTLSGLAVRGAARRRARSLATVALLASGTFLIVSIGVFRLDANRDATRPTAGTGGFALIGEATLPLVQDMNSASGREFFALNERDVEGVAFVPFRVREGDDASCLNLNRAQQPRLLGVNPALLEGRFTFTQGEGWAALKSALRTPHSALEEVPVIGDANSIQWALGRKVGDTLDFVDERGQAFKVCIVGAVANSILQGSLVMDEAEFVRRFPGASGYRYFLVDAPLHRVSDVSAALTRAMEDYGVEYLAAADRLNQFNAVQNTYLGTFQVLGGLGLLLGSAGLGIVVLRNVLERRGELAVLLALGFRQRRVRHLVLSEHVALLGLGLALGLTAAAVAVLPGLLSPGSQLPWFSLTFTLLGVLANGLLWTWMASRAALRGNLLEALRNE